MIKKNQRNKNSDQEQVRVERAGYGHISIFTHIKYYLFAKTYY